MRTGWKTRDQRKPQNDSCQYHETGLEYPFLSGFRDSANALLARSSVNTAFSRRSTVQGRYYGIARRDSVAESAGRARQTYRGDAGFLTITFSLNIVLPRPVSYLPSPRVSAH